VTAAVVHLTGPTVLERALRRAAARAGCALVGHEDQRAGHAELRGGTDGRAVALPADGDVPWVIVDHAVDTLLSACSTHPRRAEIVALAPAAWVCGPAAAGPVDAVRIGPSRTRGDAGHIVHTRLLSVQHTRCWLLDCVFLPTDDTRPLRLNRSTSVAVLTDTMPTDTMPTGTAPTDTARITQYLHDLGLGDQWSGLYVTGVADDGALRFVALCTEADWAGEQIRRALHAIPEPLP
jgi:hypothetical protein